MKSVPMKWQIMKDEQTATGYPNSTVVKQGSGAEKSNNKMEPAKDEFKEANKKIKK
jgi:hypothetical protein